MKSNYLKDFFFFIVSITLLLVFFYNAINTLTYIFDGGHHGSILLNALDIINNRIPYKEIFLQYGFLNAYINSIFLDLFNHDILSIYISTSLFYFSSILLIGFLSREFNNYYALIYSILVCIFNHPIPEYPWPNYSAFFFMTLSIYLFDIENEKKLFLSSFCIALSCLARENFYYFILPTFLFINIFLFLFTTNRVKIIFFITGFFLPILTFFIYLFLNDIFLNWLDFQRIPFVYLDSYGVSIFELLKNFIIFFLTEVPFIIGTSPQYFVIFIILIFNIYVLLEELFFKKNKNIKIIYICSLCISSMIVSINLELFRLYTSIIVGLPIIFYKLNSYKNSDTRFVVLFIILFVSFFSFFYFPKGNVKFFKNINYEKSITSSEIKFFKNQKWESDKWNFVKKIKLIDNEIVKKCKIKYVLNLTPNAFILPLSQLNRIQISPVFNEHLGREFAIKFQKNFKTLANNIISREEVYIYSMENNISILDNSLSNYKISHKVNIKGLKGSQVRVYVPNKCYNKL